MHLITRIRIADATTLLHIRDTELKHLVAITAAELGLVREEIDRRFGQLNLAAAGPQKPRWNYAH